MESAHFRGEGGAVFVIDLPLSPGYEQKIARGQLVRVNEDGSPFTEPAAKESGGKRAPKAPAKTEEKS